MRVLGVIPARLGSTRLPDKPLQLLAGEPLITRVIERVLEHRLVDRLVLATDSARVADAVKTPEVQAVMTDPSHSSGTDRVAEVAGRPEFGEFDVVVNIQGDEPFLSREALAGSHRAGEQGEKTRDRSGTPRSRARRRIRAGSKWFSMLGVGLCIFRARLFRTGATEDRKPTVCTGSTWGFMPTAVRLSPAGRSLSPSPAEQAEQLEQLRALHHGLSIGVAQLEEVALPGVDTPEDLRRAEAHWHAYQGQV